MRKITITLDPDSIGEAIKEIQKDKSDLIKKTKLLRQRVAEEIKRNADFSRCIIHIWTKIDGQTVLADRNAEVNVSVEHGDEISVVIADGDAVWCEFGTGIHYNGNPGSSPHEWGVQNGFLIGGYGKGKGLKETWQYHDSDEGLNFATHGIEAQRVLYNSVKTVRDRIDEIVKEVFA